MEGEALNTKRPRDECAADSPDPKRLREPDTIIEILDSDDKNDSSVEVIEISDDEEEDISAVVHGCLQEPSMDELRIPPTVESMPPPSSSMEGAEVIEIADDDKAESVGSNELWDSLDEISISRRHCQYEGLESGFLTEFDDGGGIGLFDFPKLSSELSDLGDYLW